MKIAEMRPPLIEISINQPKVVTLSKDKKGKSSLKTSITIAKPTLQSLLIVKLLVHR